MMTDEREVNDVEIQLVYEIQPGELSRPKDGAFGTTMNLSSNGIVAQEMGLAIPSTELTDEQRQQRTLARIDPQMLLDRDYSKKGDVAFNKIYPEGDNTANAIMKGFVKMMTTDSEFILHDYNLTARECGEYFKFCMTEKIPVSKVGLSTYLGTTPVQVERYIKSGTEVGSLLQKMCNYIAEIRTIHADEGKIPIVQHIFEMANSHGYTRNDPKSAPDVQINTINISQEDQQRILNEVVDF